MLRRVRAIRENWQGWGRFARGARILALLWFREVGKRCLGR